MKTFFDINIFLIHTIFLNTHPIYQFKSYLTLSTNVYFLKIVKHEFCALSNIYL